MTNIFFFAGANRRTQSKGNWKAAGFTPRRHFFFGANRITHLHGGQFWTMGNFDLLGGQSNLLGGHLPLIYLPEGSLLS